MYRILGSKLSLRNKMLAYKTILKPICTYGDTTMGLFKLIIDEFQSEVLSSIMGTP